LHGAKLMMGMGVLAETICYGRQIDFMSIAPQTWRKLFLANGGLKGQEAKRQCIQMCAQLGWNVEGNHDRAEACGVWAAAHLKWGNAKAIRQLLSHMSVRSMERAS